MALQLPRPIELFFTSDRAGDTEALSRCFAADATVQDEGRTFEGLAAIRAWRIGAKKKYDYTVEPIEAVHGDAGTVAVTARVTGNFPGSPVDLAFNFRLAGGEITSLEIRA